MMSWRFQPPWWAVCGVIVGVGCLSALGTWQVHRGQAKQVLLDQVALSAHAPLQDFNGQQMVADSITHVRVSGRYEATRQLLLDNQSHAQKPGYQVWTPLRLASGEMILVNRGWIPLTNRAQLPALPAPEEPQQLTGYWQALPQAGMRLASTPCAKAVTFPQIVNYPSVEELACLYGEPVSSGELLLDQSASDGYVREWTFDNGFPPTRHYGYALQWFALAVTLLIIFLKLNLKRVENTKHE